jgi:hypothetical protein
MTSYLSTQWSTIIFSRSCGQLGHLKPDGLSEDAPLIIETVYQHEWNILEELKGSGIDLPEVPSDGNSIEATRRPARYAHFTILDKKAGRYQIWDTKPASSLKDLFESFLSPEL